MQSQGGRVIKERRQVELCFGCKDKYFPKHQCKKQSLLPKGEEGVAAGKEEIIEPSEIEREDNGEISPHALRGLANSKIIKVEGKVQDYKLMILIDNGSTHSFLDEGTARKLNCKLIGTQPLAVTVTNGSP